MAPLLPSNWLRTIPNSRSRTQKITAFTRNTFDKFAIAANATSSNISFPSREGAKEAPLKMDSWMDSGSVGIFPSGANEAQARRSAVQHRTPVNELVQVK